MVKVLIEKYKVDANKIFVAGYSNGAYMGYRLACEKSDKFAGIVSFVGAFSFKNPYSEDCIGKTIKKD